jgi:hypothetical protein
MSYHVGNFRTVTVNMTASQAFEFAWTDIELHNLNYSPDMKKMGCTGHVARRGEKGNVYGVLVRKTEGD